MKLAASKSPCRISPDKPNHACSAEHATTVEAYRAWREQWEVRADHESMGYAAELAEYRQDNQPPTFKAWLIANVNREA